MKTEWQRISDELEKNLKPGIFQVWIKPLQGQIQDNHLTLLAPNSFVASWIKDRHIHDVHQAALETLGKELTISVSVDTTTKTHPTPTPNEGIPRPIALPLQYHSAGTNTYNWRFTFDDFVVGPCNELAYVACNSICHDQFPTDQLFISSAPGLGKTHLIQAVGHHFRSTQKTVRVGYLTAEEFGNQMIMSLKAREIDKFKAKYREAIDILLLEDIHFFQGKEKMQEELLSTIKYLQSHGRKVIFTSSFLPKELSRVDSQLTSQFCSGFLAVINKPDHNLRLRIIDHKARSLQVQITEDISDYVARNIRSDIRQLESCIKSMAIKAKLLRERITMELARDVLNNYIEQTRRSDIGHITSFVSQSFDIPVDTLKSKSRKQNIVQARNTVFYLARKHTELSLKDIGQHLNRRHSTVVKGISNVEREIHRGTSVGKQVQKIAHHMTQ